jgi:cell wall-associated NlpC family hydrolase
MLPNPASPSGTAAEASLYRTTAEYAHLARRAPQNDKTSAESVAALPAIPISCVVVRTVRGVVSLTAAAVALVVLLPGSSDAQTVRPMPSLSSLEAKASQLSNQVDSLGQQYDGLRIQLTNAESEEKTAELAAKRAQAALVGDQKAVDQLAAMGYMNEGMDPALQMLESGNPTQFLNESSTIEQIDNEAGMRLSTVQKEQLAANRAEAEAKEQIANVDTLHRQIQKKISQINGKLAVLNSSEMSQAMSIFASTGQYPDYTPAVSGNSLEVRALREALTRLGDPYVWGAAGPKEFDCSGLVVWAYAQLGVSLPHYTGSLWDLGTPVSENNLQPGDLVFFFQDISHVGIFIGNGLMVDAPSTGQDVMVQQVFWNDYVGARRITG